MTVSHEMPVQYRYAGDLATGEKRMELKVVPGLSLHVEPAVMIVPLKVAAGVDRRKEVRVTVENNTKGAATREHRLESAGGVAGAPGLDTDLAHRGRGVRPPCGSR